MSKPPLVKQPTKVPTRKVGSGAAYGGFTAGAATTLLLFVFNRIYSDGIPDDVYQILPYLSAFLTWGVQTARGYFAKERADLAPAPTPTTETT
jgi:hypothetical protein